MKQVLILSFIGLFQVVDGAFCRWMEDRDLVLKCALLTICLLVLLYLFMFYSCSFILSVLDGDKIL